MSGCEPARRVVYNIKTPLWGRGASVSLDAGLNRACEAGNVSFSIEGGLSDADAKKLVGALKIFPSAFLQRFFAGRIFRPLPKGEFNAISAGSGQAFSSRMGIKVFGAVWYLNEDIFHLKSDKRFLQRIWYAAGSFIADSLEGEDGFDGKRFQAAFNRYLTQRFGNPLVQPWISTGIFLHGVERMYNIYLDRLAESNAFDTETLKRIFKEARDDFRKTRRPNVSTRLMAGQQAPWFGERLYQQFVDEGLEWRITPDNVINLSLQNAKSRERPDSSHRVNLHYYSGDLNRFLGRAANSIVHGLDLRIFWAPGLVASYESRDVDGVKNVAVLAGSLLDVGVATTAGEFGLHSYLGFPASIQFSDNDGVRDSHSPEWEIGLQFRREDKKGRRLFIGGVASVPAVSPYQSYFGLIGRIEM